MKEIKNVFLSLGMKGRSGEEIDTELCDMILTMEDYCEEHCINIPKFVDNFACERPSDNNQRLWWLGEAIKKLGDCDTILLSYDYMNYNGCKVELEVARNYGLNILYLDIDVEKMKFVVREMK